jgi:hypothetical protein
MAYLCSSGFDDEGILYYSDAICQLSLLLVDEICAIDLCALGGGLDVWDDRFGGGDFGETAEVLRSIHFGEQNGLPLGCRERDLVAFGGLYPLFCIL